MSRFRALLIVSLFTAAVHAAEVRPSTRPPADARDARIDRAPVATAGPCSEREPNESIGTASAASIPSSCSGFASATDASAIRITYDDGSSDGIEDVFAFTLVVPAKLTVELTPSASTGDLDVFLFSWSDNRPRFVALANHDAAGAVERFTLTNPLAAGTYYVGVSAYSGGTAYTLALSAPGYSATCAPDPTSLCLNNGRFRVTADWTTGDGNGQGRGVLLTHETGYFWFFADTNVEVIVKMLDACSLNSRFWTFSGGLTDVAVTMRVTDTVTGETKTYTNPSGTPWRTITDTSAFATCSGASCSYAVSPQSQSFSANGGTNAVSVTTTASCAWTASSDAPWVTITSGASGTGNGTVTYAVASNGGTSTRNATLTVAGRSVAISQSGATPSCTFGVSPLSRDFGASGGTGTADVSTQAGCGWTATSNASWISVTGGASGSGNGTVSYAIAANPGLARNGTLTVAGRTVSINQAAGTTSGDRDGTWGGTTNEGETVGFTISGGKISQFKMSFTFGVPGNQCKATITITYGASSQPSTTASGFSFTFSPPGLSTAINGSFSGTTAVNGTYGQVNLNNFQCGSATVNGYKAGGTFTASKQ